MSTSQAKVAIDKLLKIYEPLKEAQKVLTDIEVADQVLREKQNALTGINNEIEKKHEQLRLSEQEANHASAVKEQILNEADNKAREIIADARAEAEDILLQMENAKTALQAEIDAFRATSVLLDREVAAKQEELVRVTTLVNEQREKLKQALTAI